MKDDEKYVLAVSRARRVCSDLPEGEKVVKRVQQRFKLYEWCSRLENGKGGGERSLGYINHRL